MIKGKVVLIPFPFDDLSSTKVLPAVCLTEPTGIYNHIILAFLTSQISANLLDSDILIEPNNIDFSATGLRVASILKLNRLITVRKSLIKRELGKLSPSLQYQVDQKLRQLFNLN
jgi:mRNA interferase MazF